MKTLPLLLATSGLVMLGLTACNPQSNAPVTTTSAKNVADQSKTVMTVDGQPITENLIQFYGKARFGSDSLSDDQKKIVEDDVIQLYALAAEAKKQGLDKEVETLMRLKMQSQSMLAQLVMQKFSEGNQVSDEDVRAAFDQGSAGTEYKARHILLKEEAEAQAVIAELEGGADFAELATNKSTGPSAPKGGDLGWFPATQMVAPFAEALPGIEPGTYSKQPVQTQFGWHVILVEDTRKQEFDQVKARLKEKITNDRVKAYLDSIKSNATVARTP